LHQFKKTISAMVTSGGAGVDLQMLASNQSSFSESAPSARSVGASADYKASALSASVRW
jgi:hypothetical protein